MIKLSKSGITHLLEIPNVVKIIRMAIQKLTGTIKDRENKPKIFCKITLMSDCCYQQFCRYTMTRTSSDDNDVSFVLDQHA
jgi:hypothetical protein